MQTEIYATGSVDLGAPILDASASLNVGSTTS
jgi:hypothetical protein